MTITLTTSEPTGSPLLELADRLPNSPASRLRLFDAYLARQGRDWLTPDLAGWRDELLRADVAPSSVAAYLGTVRAAYGRIVRSNDLRDRLWASLPADSSPERRKAIIDEMITRLENAIRPQAAPVSITKKQDKADSEGIRLTSEQASRLLAQPGVATLKGLRDTAIMATLLCTGLREAELVALEIDDLRQALNGELAVWVRHGKGNKARLVPWGALDWALALVEAWLRRAGIEHGAVFRGMQRGDKIKAEAISTRAIQLVLHEYPIIIGGKQVRVRPHDCRRTYARRLYEAGMDMLAIQQNLGHSDSKTTRKYIGALDADQRRPPAVYEFDMRGVSG